MHPTIPSLPAKKEMKIQNWEMAKQIKQQQQWHAQSLHNCPGNNIRPPQETAHSQLAWRVTRYSNLTGTVSRIIIAADRNFRRCRSCHCWDYTTTNRASAKPAPIHCVWIRGIETLSLITLCRMRWSTVHAWLVGWLGDDIVHHHKEYNTHNGWLLRRQAASSFTSGLGNTRWEYPDLSLLFYIVIPTHHCQCCMQHLNQKVRRPSFREDRPDGTAITVNAACSNIDSDETVVELVASSMVIMNNDGECLLWGR